MEFTFRSKAAVGAAALVCGVLVAGSTAASASGDSSPPVWQQASPGGGAVDLNGLPVPSRTYVGDTLPSDLGTLQGSGSATAGPGPATGTFPE